MRKILILSLGFALSLGAQAKDYHRTADTTTVVCRLSADGMLRPLKPSYMKGALVASPWTDNWFVQAAGGTTVFLGKPLGCNDLFGRMKPAFYKYRYLPEVLYPLELSSPSDAFSLLWVETYRHSTVLPKRQMILYYRLLPANNHYAPDYHIGCHFP
jgi:hypothetical protein